MLMNNEPMSADRPALPAMWLKLAADEMLATAIALGAETP